MATKQENNEIERAQFNHIKQYLPNFENLDEQTLDTLLEGGMIQVSTVLEHALAHVGGYDVVSEDQRDFNDACNSDGKMSSVRTSSKGSGYSAQIKGLNKMGSLRAVIYERITEKHYYFHIPYEAYKDVPKKSSIEIPFDQGGLPKRQNNSRGIDWWDYEEKSFEDLAKQMKDPLTRRREQNDTFFTQMPGTRGGKVPGRLSDTPNAVRKRELRAQKRDQNSGSEPEPV
jgi:hypothetical protein